MSRYPNISAVIERLEQNRVLPGVGTALAALYIAVGEEDRAIEIYKIMDLMGPQDYYNLGTIYLVKKQDYSMAKEQFEQALELVEARYKLGMTYLHEGKWERAADQFEQLAERFDINGIEIETVDGILLDHVIKQYSCNNMGVCRYKADEFREARRWFGGSFALLNT